MRVHHLHTNMHICFHTNVTLSRACVSCYKVASAAETVKCSFLSMLMKLMLIDLNRLTWRRVSILRLNFEIFLFLVSEELAVPSIRTASIDCFHQLPSPSCTRSFSFISLFVFLSLFLVVFLTGTLEQVEVAARTGVPISVCSLLTGCSNQRVHCHRFAATHEKKTHLPFC